MAFTLAFLEAGSVFAAVCLLMVARAHPSLMDDLGIPAVVTPALAVSVCCLVSFYYNDLYELGALRDIRGMAPRLLQSLGVTFLLVGAVYTLLPGVEVSPPLMISLFLLVIGLVVPLRAVSYGLIARRAAPERVLILGTGPLARKIAEEIQVSPVPYAVVGMVDDSSGPDGTSAGGGVSAALVRPLTEVETLVSELCPDRLVVALSERRGRLPVWGLLSSCAGGLRVEDGIEFYEGLTRKLAIESLSPSFLIFHRVLQKSALQLAVRRVLSLVAATLGLLLAAPLMAVVAVLVKLDSPGRVFFVQERVGLRGRIFRLIKFRTMQGPPPEGHSVWLRDDCPRLTRLGRRLRDLHLDELPQFINVLKGDMDLVGPRPEMACNVQTMTEQIPYYGLRHTVRPGVTGWAQIKQGYSVSQAEVTEKMRYDLYYIKHMSLWLDLRIVLATARIVLFGRKVA
jgi:exopolysaccharide biosynthesis polyprenyl glycosylphosphotransferase